MVNACGDFGEYTFTLDDLSLPFGSSFTADELVKMANILEIPDTFITKSRYQFLAVEALALLCARFSSAGDIYDLSVRHDRSQSSISEVINELSIYLDETWKHLLDFDEHHLLSPANLKRYAGAIYKAGAPLQTIWSFIDCTLRQMCRPSRWQRQAYSGHKKYHAVKFQALNLPNGLFGHLFGPLEGRRNDNYLAEESRIFEKARQHAFREGANANTPIGQRYYHIFGDPAYGVSPVLMSPFTGEKTEAEQQWNNEMSSVRISVEHGFGGVLNTWPFLCAFWKQRVHSSPVGRYYRVGVLLFNAISCFRPNQTSQRYNCEPPTAEEYFHH